jgi:hypothetical protein
MTRVLAMSGLVTKDLARSGYDRHPPAERRPIPNTRSANGATTLSQKAVFSCAELDLWFSVDQQGGR